MPQPTSSLTVSRRYGKERKPPRAFMDYEIVANEEAIPAGGTNRNAMITIKKEEELLALSGLQHWPFASGSGPLSILKVFGQKTAPP